MPRAAQLVLEPVDDAVDRDRVCLSGRLSHVAILGRRPHLNAFRERIRTGPLLPADACRPAEVGRREGGVDVDLDAAGRLRRGNERAGLATVDDERPPQLRLELRLPSAPSTGLPTRTVTCPGTSRPPQPAREIVIGRRPAVPVRCVREATAPIQASM